MAIHRSYLKTVYPYIKNGVFKAVAHITGGGFDGNIRRILPPHLDAIVDTTFWWPPKIYGLIQKLADVDTKEMYRVFNMGIGMVAVLAEKDIPYVKKTMKNPNCEVVPVGTLVPGKGKVVIKI
jgi:phosphoribosylformylglycinamidine cyclo-ligase